MRMHLIAVVITCLWLIHTGEGLTLQRFEHHGCIGNTISSTDYDGTCSAASTTSSMIYTCSSGGAQVTVITWAGSTECDDYAAKPQYRYVPTATCINETTSTGVMQSSMWTGCEEFGGGMTATNIVFVGLVITVVLFGCCVGFIKRHRAAAEDKRARLRSLQDNRGFDGEHFVTTHHDGSGAVTVNSSNGGNSSGAYVAPYIPLTNTPSVGGNSSVV